MSVDLHGILTHRVRIPCKSTVSCLGVGHWSTHGEIWLTPWTMRLIGCFAHSRDMNVSSAINVTNPISENVLVHLLSRGSTYLW